MRLTSVLNLALGLILSSTLLSPVWAQCAKDSNKTVLNSEETTEPLNFEEFKVKFENRMGVSIAESCDGVTFYADKLVLDGVDVNHPDFPKKLQLGYERLMFKLQAQLVMDLYGRQTVKRISELMNDDSTNARAWSEIKKELDEAKNDQNKISKILNKTLDLMDKKLDNELIKEGIPADKVQKSSLAEKKTIFKDNFSKESIKNAIGDMAGLVPVHTKIFTGKNSKGEFVTLGIIAVRSAKTITFAQSIAKKQESGIKGSPNKLKDILPSTNEGYLNEIGLRYVYDEDGRPTLISYAQWSVTAKTDSASRLERLKEVAQDTASDLAQSNITEFAKSSLVISDTKIVGDISEDISTRITQFENTTNIGSEEKIEQISEIISKTIKKATSTASMQLRGSSELKKWEAVDPKTQVVHLGAVRKFSFKELENQNKMDTQLKPNQAGGSSQDKNLPSVNRDSKPVNKASDF